MGKGGKFEILILGGGLAGLSCAYFLEKRGAGDYAVLEKSGRPGGLLKTNRENGIVMDELPHVFFSGDAEMTAFFRKMAGPCRRHRHNLGVLWNKNLYIDYPFQNNLGRLPLKEKIEILQGLLNRPSGRKFLNLSDYAESVLGSGIVSLFFRPYNEKLWLAKLGEMDYRWLFSKISMPNDRELAESLLNAPAKKRSAVAPHFEFLYPEKGGIESFIDGLMRHIPGEKLLLGEKAVKLDLKRKTVHTRKGTFKYGKLVSTLPLDRLADIAGIPTGFRFRATRVVCCHFIAENAVLPRYHWIYVPGKEIPFYRITRADLINGNAASGKKAVLVESAVPRGFHDTGSLERKILSSMEKLGILRRKDLLAKRVFSHFPAYPVPTVGFERTVKRLETKFARSSVYLAGRFSFWKIMNMDHTVASAFEAARRVLRE